VSEALRYNVAQMERTVLLGGVSTRLPSTSACPIMVVPRNAGDRSRR
jgi:hypothetical protein